VTDSIDFYVAETLLLALKISQCVAPATRNFGNSQTDGQTEKQTNGQTKDIKSLKAEKHIKKFLSDFKLKFLQYLFFNPF